MKYSNQNQEVASKLANAVNCFCDCKKVAEYMSREHRTLQQTFTRVCVEWLRVLSEQECYDARNEASVKLAKSLMSIFEVRDLFDKSGLPMI